MAAMNIQFLGHASFLLDHPSSGTVLIDPWLSGNPVCPFRLEDIQAADFVCVTHGHRDHFADAIPICSRTGAKLIASAELCGYAARHGIAYDQQSYPLNIGGTFRSGAWAATMVQSMHTSAIQGRQFYVDRTLEPGGGATGFILKFADEFTLYVTGDTGVFTDMQLFAELYRPDLVILPVGGRYTMGPLEAAKALAMIQPRWAIPCHYSTFAHHQAINIDDFVERTRQGSPHTLIHFLKPGERLLLEP